MKVGDVVQLNSGGAPMTIVGVVSSSSWPGRGGTYRLACNSPGGLVQTLEAEVYAFRKYSGERTAAAHKKKDNW